MPSTTGNSAVHMCVWHNRKAMLEHLISKYSTAVDLAIPNQQGHTPLLMSVLMERQEMFQLIMDSLAVTLWVYGPIICRQYPITELDTLLGRSSVMGMDKADMRSASVLSLIADENITTMFEPIVLQLITDKWQAYGWWLYSMWLGLFALNQALLFASTANNKGDILVIITNMAPPTTQVGR